MNPTLGLLLPLALAQPPEVVGGPGCAYCPTPTPVVGPRAPFAVPPHLLASPKAQGVCPPAGPPAPLLAMKAVLAEGYTVTVDPTEKGYAAGSRFGFRPGYTYRLKFTSAADPAATVGGSLEVRGSLVPRPNLRYMEFPALLTVSATDVKAALGGGLVSKAIYLEDPAKALPFEQKAGEPLEVSADTEREALSLAADGGRVVAVLRIGGRVPTKAEWADQFADGTILLPGEAALSRPALPPQFGTTAVPVYDPILGPKVPGEECFPNGGDRGPAAGVGPGDRLGNLDPTDTVMLFSSGGVRKAVTSNTVCLCSPRFVARRAEVTASAVSAAVSPQVLVGVVVRSVFTQRWRTQELVGRERTLGLHTKLRPAAAVNVLALDALTSTQGVKGVGSTLSAASVHAVVVVDELNSYPTRLTLEKSVSPAGPYQPSDEVTITLRYANNTRQPITDLEISDSLSGRLEYVAGSALADRPSTVTTAPNEAGSVVVRFDLPGPIPPAASGVVVFKVKVR